MKWLAPIVALVLLGASLVPPAWAQPPPLTYAQPLSQTGVAAVQLRLKQNGAYGGPTDGVWGPESAAALEQFQRAHGLPASWSRLTSVFLVSARPILENASRSRPMR
jgi:peptidoglycan hydrolase-like protein with peptidoglycan-binding domain